MDYRDRNYEFGNVEEPDDKALEAARMEAQVYGRRYGAGTGYGAGAGAGLDGPNGEGETPKQTLRRLFQENSLSAAQTIIKLSMSASGERVRLDAAKYIVERVLGPMQTGAGGVGGVGGVGDDDAEPGSLEHTLNQMAKNIKG